MAKNLKKILLKENEGQIIINSDCTRCGICVLECPTDAIYEGEKIMEVDDSKCIYCKVCIPVCPIDQIALKPLVFNNILHEMKAKFWYAEKE